MNLLYYSLGMQSVKKRTYANADKLRYTISIYVLLLVLFLAFVTIL